MKGLGGGFVCLRSDFFFLSEVQSGFRTKMQEIKPLPKGLGSSLELSQQMQWLSHFRNQRSVQIHLYIFKRNIPTTGTAVSQCKKKHAIQSTFKGVWERVVGFERVWKEII